MTLRGGGVHAPCGIGDEQVLVPFACECSREVCAEVVAVPVGQGIRSSQEIAVARPVGKTGMVAWVEHITLVVLMSISEAPQEGPLVGGSPLDIEVLGIFVVLGEILRSDGGVIQRVIIGGA